jgi:beta-RFAP synthase
MTMPEATFVETTARLHLGVLDLRGECGRWFGGIGAAAPAPTLLLSASAGDTVDVEGEDAERATVFTERFLAHYGIERGARVRVHRALRPHAGLGSGTQLALAVARALADVYGIDPDGASLARAVGRGQRSAIGILTFTGPGLVVEGGRRREGTECGPLIARLPFPKAWQCVVAVPAAKPGVSGLEEASAFAQLPAPPARDVERVAHLVLMSLLPALAESDLPAFGTALGRIQDLTGQWFAPVQGGTFAVGAAAALVRSMREWGAAGVGQSSWGPAVYGIVEGEAAMEQLADHVRRTARTDVEVHGGAFPTSGARIWRGSSRIPVPAR